MAFLPGTVVLTTGVINGHGDYSIGRRRFLNIAQKQHLQFVTAYQGRGLEESQRCVFVCAGILFLLRANMTDLTLDIIATQPARFVPLVGVSP